MKYLYPIITVVGAVFLFLFSMAELGYSNVLVNQLDCKTYGFVLGIVVTSWVISVFKTIPMLKNPKPRRLSFTMEQKTYNIADIHVETVRVPVGKKNKNEAERPQGERSKDKGGGETKAESEEDKIKDLKAGERKFKHKKRRLL